MFVILLCLIELSIFNSLGTWQRKERFSEFQRLQGGNSMRDDCSIVKSRVNNFGMDSFSAFSGHSQSPPVMTIGSRNVVLL